MYRKNWRSLKNTSTPFGQRLLWDLLMKRFRIYGSLRMPSLIIWFLLHSTAAVLFFIRHPPLAFSTSPLAYGVALASVNYYLLYDFTIVSAAPVAIGEILIFSGGVMGLGFHPFPRQMFWHPSRLSRNSHQSRLPVDTASYLCLLYLA